MRDRPDRAGERRRGRGRLALGRRRAQRRAPDRRLVPHGDAAPLRAGVEIRVKPGWHTYWRYPGDAGVPPRFDFAGSQNVKAVDVLWPAPQAIPEEGGTVIGYTDNVILPLPIVPQNRAKPVTLRLKLDYAICEKLCVPAEGKAELELAGGASSQDAALAAAEARVPKKLAVGEGHRSRSSRFARGGRRGRASSSTWPRRRETRRPVRRRADADWALPVPAPIEGAPSGTQRFAFDARRRAARRQVRGAPITLTAVAGNEAIEVVIRLD